MAKETAADALKGTRITISSAFPGDEAPGPVSVAIVSLVELCQLAMPDPAKIRERLGEAQFVLGPQDRADDAGRMLALDSKLVDDKVNNLRHEIYGKERHLEPVLIVLSVGDSRDGKIVFCSALFRGVIEADAVKAAAHVLKKQPFTGSTVRNADGNLVRRVFWDAEGAAGVRGFVVSGPHNLESLDLPRAFTAFNKVARKG